MLTAGISSRAAANQTQASIQSRKGWALLSDCPYGCDEAALSRQICTMVVTASHLLAFVTTASVKKCAVQEGLLGTNFTCPLQPSCREDRKGPCSQHNVTTSRKQTTEATSPECNPDKVELNKTLCFYSACGK